MRIALFFCFMLSISGCASISSAPHVAFDEAEPNAGRKFSDDELRPREIPETVATSAAIKETGNHQVVLTYDNHPSGASREIRATARQTYLYAQLATNAYDEDDKFKLPNVDGPFNPNVSWSGFGARYFKIAGANGEAKCVIAFRGTDFFYPNDWIFGNLLNTQYKQGLAYFDELRQGKECRAADGRELPIAVVGHSLGGAIATYISLRRELAPSFVFNTSPRLTRGSAILNERIAVSQYAEVLASLRHVFILAGGTYTTINCKKGGPIGRHSIRPLAECLTAIAASDPEKDGAQDPAVISANANGIKYEGQILQGRSAAKATADAGGSGRFVSR